MRFVALAQDDPTPEQVQEKLQALGPVLDKLKGLDPKAFKHEILKSKIKY